MLSWALMFGSYVETLLYVYIPDLTEVHSQTLGHVIKHLRENSLVSDEYIEQLSSINNSIVEENHGADDPREDSYTNLSDDELAALCIASKEFMLHQPVKTYRFTI